MDEHAMDASVTYQDLEPLIEATVNDPLPEGLVEQQWLDLPEIEQHWLELPDLEQGWLDLPEIEQHWLHSIDHEGPEHVLETLDIEHEVDLDH